MGSDLEKAVLDVFLGIKSCALFVWLISHQPAVLFSQNKPAISNQPAVLYSQNKPAPAISHQPTEQADGRKGRSQLEIFHSSSTDSFPLFFLIWITYYLPPNG
jgi:hypothetical protein